MKTNLVWLSAIGVLIAACGESLGPGLSGRWAASGIELISRGTSGELRLPCVPPVQFPRDVRFTADGRIRFPGAVRELWYNYDFIFSGHVQGDTLAASLTVRLPGEEPKVIQYVMTRDGESGLQKQVCLV